MSLAVAPVILSPLRVYIELTWLLFQGLLNHREFFLMLIGWKPGQIDSWLLREHGNHLRSQPHWYAKRSDCCCEVPNGPSLQVCHLCNLPGLELPWTGMWPSSLGKRLRETAPKLAKPRAPCRPPAIRASWRLRSSWCFCLRYLGWHAGDLNSGPRVRSDQTSLALSEACVPRMQFSGEPWLAICSCSSRNT